MCSDLKLSYGLSVVKVNVFKDSLLQITQVKRQTYIASHHLWSDLYVIYVL